MRPVSISPRGPSRISLSPPRPTVRTSMARTMVRQHGSQHRTDGTGTDVPHRDTFDVAALQGLERVAGTVGVMLVLLGARALYRIVQERIHFHEEDAPLQAGQVPHQGQDGHQQTDNGNE